MKLILATFVSAAALLAHGSLDAQIENATRALAADPGNAQHYVRRGELHRLHRDWRAALADFEAAEKRNPGEPAFVLGRARVHFDRGQLGEAVAALNGYLRLRPDSEAALVLRAQSHSGLGSFELAAADFAAAIRVSREPQPDYFLGEARARLAAGEASGALAAIDSGLARLGAVPALEEWAIDEMTSRGRHAEAIARLDAVLARTARQETLLARRAELLMAAGRVEEARDCYRLALRAWEQLPERTRQTKAMIDLRARLVIQ